MLSATSRMLSPLSLYRWDNALASWRDARLTARGSRSEPRAAGSAVCACRRMLLRSRARAAMRLMT